MADVIATENDRSAKARSRRLVEVRAGEFAPEVANPRNSNVFKPLNALGASVEVAVWTPAAGKRYRLIAVAVVSSVAGNLVFRDGVAGPVVLVVPSAAGGVAPVPLDLGDGILSGAADRPLTITGPATSAISGVVMGTEE